MLVKRKLRYLPEHVLKDATEALMEYYQKDFELHRLASLMSFYYTLGGLSQQFNDPHAIEKHVLTLPSHHQQLEAVAEWYMEFEGNVTYYENFLVDLETILLEQQLFYVVVCPIPLHTAKYIEKNNEPIHSVW